MSDLISRQAAVDLIRQYKPSPNDKGNEPYSDGLDMAITLVSNMPPVPASCEACRYAQCTKLDDRCRFRREYDE